MAKYHVKADGAVGACSAKEGKCPFTAADAEHFDNKKNALLFSTAVIAKLEGGSFAQAGFSRELVGDALHNPPPESVNTGEVAFFNGSKVHLNNLWKAVNESPEIAAEVTAAIEASAYPDWSWEYVDPDYAVSPGDHIEEWLDDQGINAAELARRLDVTPKHVSELLSGKAPLSATVALGLERVTGIPARIWNRFEAGYREDLARLAERREFEGLSALSLYHFEIGGKSVWAVTHGMSGADERNTNEWAFGLEQTRNATYFSNEEDAQNYWNKLEQAVREEYPDLPN